MTVRAASRSETKVAGVIDPAKVRNIVLVGPSGGGKTTLVEALLAHTSAIPRAGAVTDGTTVCDHDPAAVRQQRSVALAVAPVLHEEHKINLIDTPGYGDFVGELRAGLRAADAALFVIPANEGREGLIDPATVAQWEECAAVGMPRAVVVARCDHARADQESTIAACQESFGAGVAPLYLPIRDGESMTGLYGLLSQTPAGQAPDGAEDARATLIEGIIEQSEDETLMERYLEGEDIEVTTLIDDLETAVARGTFHPVIPVCASSGIGLDALLEVLIGGFPSPLEHPLPRRLGHRRLRARRALGRPRRPVGRGGRAHVGRRLRGPGVARAGVLRHAARRHHRAHQRPPRAHPGPAHVVLRRRRARQRRAPRARLLADGRHAQPGGGVRRGRHLRAHQARQRRDRRHGVGRRRSPAARVLEPARAAAARSRSPPTPGATRTRW